MALPEFVFELHACRWVELDWPPGDRTTDDAILVARQLGSRNRRWDTIVFECDPQGLRERRAFGDQHLDGDLLHVVRNAPIDWAWYRDALPHPGYPWRYVREAVHAAADRDILETRRQSNRIEIRRRAAYPDWVNRIVAIEHKPDLDASAADALAHQLEYDIALGLADEVWLATQTTEEAVPPALFEKMPVEVGILSLDPIDLDAEVRWHPRQLAVDTRGTRILERPTGTRGDRSAARFEFVDAAEKRAKRREIAERAYERGWRSAIEHMRPDCRHFELAADSLTHEPHCAAKGRAQRAAECHGGCAAFEPEPPTWRTGDWPITGGPGKGAKAIYDAQRSRFR